MPLFVLTYGYHDTPQRSERRADHLAHLERLSADGAVVAAGPLADLSGGIIVLQAEDEASAQQLVEQDPYTQHGVTKDRTLQEWKVTVGSLAG